MSSLEAAVAPDRRLTRRQVLGAAPVLALGGAIGVTTDAIDPAAAAAASGRPLHIGVWDRASLFGAGSVSAARVDATGGVVLGGGTTRVVFDDPHGPARIYRRGYWTSSRITLPFGATQLIGSWNATTPDGTWVEVAVQGRTTTGQTTRWYVLGRWTSRDGADDIKRASVEGQSDTYATVETDTLVLRAGYRLASYVMRVNLYRRAGTTATPRVSLVSAIASALPNATTVPTSTPGPGAGRVLAVPTYSQERHRGHLPQYNGGGEAWCSATSTAMVLDYWKLGPSAATTSWVTIPGETRPQVDHAARCTYDYTYEGTGNWPFNTAYAGSRGARAYVTRLRSLLEAEHFIAAGVPLIVSVSFTSSQLTGAGYGTNGHLMVIVGFTSAGDVVVNDPASHLMARDSQVRVTYRRAQFENVWIPRGGTAYVITPPGHRLPRTLVAGEPNWA